MITVHHLENSRSQRVLWLLEELGLEYEVQRYERNRKTMLAPPELKRVHPLGKSPVITDDQHTVAETGAIIEYLVDNHANGALAPAPGTSERLRYTYWLHYAEGSLMPWLLMRLAFDSLSRKPAPLPIRPLGLVMGKGVKAQFIDPQIALHLDYLEGELAEHPWFAGENFTAADVMMSFPLEAASTRGGLGENRPKLNALVERMQARSAYQQALERGGPYDLNM